MYKYILIKKNIDATQDKTCGALYNRANIKERWKSYSENCMNATPKPYETMLHLVKMKKLLSVHEAKAAKAYLN